MKEETNYNVEEIIAAGLSRVTLQPSGDLAKRFSLYTKNDVILKYEDVTPVKFLISHLEKKHGVKLKIIGGGYGCTRFTFKVEGTDDAADLVRKLMKDKTFLELAALIEFEVVVVPKSCERYTIPRIDKTDREKYDNSANDRISADGTVQRVR